MRKELFVINCVEMFQIEAADTCIHMNRLNIILFTMILDYFLQFEIDLNGNVLKLFTM